MNVTGHTTRMRSRTRLTAYGRQTDVEAHAEIPGLGDVDDEQLLLGGLAIAVVGGAVLLLGGGDRAPEVNIS